MNEYIDIINDLNEELFTKHGEVQYEFNYATNGHIHIINFQNIELWNSEIDERVYNEETDEYEPLKGYIKKQYNMQIEYFERLKFKNED